MPDKLLFNHEPQVHKPIGTVTHSYILDGELIFVLRLDGEEFERQAKQVDSADLLDEENKPQ